ncbi:hypothetical protein ACFLQ2_00225 [archaeon]
MITVRKSMGLEGKKHSVVEKRTRKLRERVRKGKFTSKEVRGVFTALLNNLERKDERGHSHEGVRAQTHSLLVELADAGLLNETRVMRLGKRHLTNSDVEVRQMAIHVLNKFMATNELSSENRKKLKKKAKAGLKLSKTSLEGIQEDSEKEMGHVGKLVGDIHANVLKYTRKKRTAEKLRKRTDNVRRKAVPEQKPKVTETVNQYVLLGAEADRDIEAEEAKRKTMRIKLWGLERTLGKIEKIHEQHHASLEDLIQNLS